MKCIAGVIAGGHRINDGSIEAQTFIDITGITNVTIQNAIFRLAADLRGVSNGVYTTFNIMNKFIAIYPFVGGSSSSCSYNLVNPAVHPLVFSGSPTFDSTGYVGTVMSYAKTGIIPSAEMVLNSSHMSLSIASGIVTSPQADMGCVNTSTQRMNMFARLTGDLQFSDMYSTAARATVSYSSTTGVYLISSRENSTTFTLLRDGVSVATHGPTGGTLPALEIVIGGVNIAETYISVGVVRGYKFATVGQGLTSAESLALYNAEHFFNVTTLGR